MVVYQRTTLTILARTGNNVRMAKAPSIPLVTLAEAAARTKLSDRTLRHACVRGFIPSVLAGKTYLVRLSDVLTFAKNRPKPGRKATSR